MQTIATTTNARGEMRSKLHPKRNHGINREPERYLGGKSLSLNEIGLEGRICTLYTLLLITYYTLAYDGVWQGFAHIRDVRFSCKHGAYGGYFTIFESPAL